MKNYRREIDNLRKEAKSWMAKSSYLKVVDDFEIKKS